MVLLLLFFTFLRFFKIQKVVTFYVFLPCLIHFLELWSTLRNKFNDTIDSGHILLSAAPLVSVPKSNMISCISDVQLQVLGLEVKALVLA